MVGYCKVPHYLCYNNNNIFTIIFYRMKRQIVRAGEKSTRIQDQYFFPVRNIDFTLNGYLQGDRLQYDFGDKKYDDDWLKWAGVYLDNYKPHGRTTMVAMRYRKDLDMWEWTFYHHNVRNRSDYEEVGSVPGLIKPDNTIFLPNGIAPEWKVNFLGKSRRKIELSLGTPKVITDKGFEPQIIKDAVEFSKFGRTHTRGNLYLGGDAPWRKDQGDLIGYKKYKKGL